ncbi:HAD family hydrolase [[Clostridium] colinum]|uniref:HAD family hydrolase n=1 Tax=[Clostridium] colinum TaxID=36835 RepID=UPI002024EB33|nr:HAD family phosphatase [[Clostridium] colinum]
MYKAIIFDMDGVILDTEKLLMKCWQTAGNEFGICIENKHLSKMRGGTIPVIKNIFEEIFGKDLDFYKIRERREAIKDEYISKNGVPVKEGIEEFLKYIKDNNIKISLATSTIKDIAIKYLKEVDLYKYFDEIVCGDMIENGKPSPDIYLEACKRLNVNPKEALVFEDSRNGIWAGYSAGCDVAMVVDIDDKYEDTEDKIILKIESYKQAIDFLEKAKEK